MENVFLHLFTVYIFTGEKQNKTTTIGTEFKRQKTKQKQNLKLDHSTRLYGHRQSVGAVAFWLTHNVKPCLIIGLTKVGINQASVQCVLSTAS